MVGGCCGWMGWAVAGGGIGVGVVTGVTGVGWVAGGGTGVGSGVDWGVAAGWGIGVCVKGSRAARTGHG